MRSLIRKTFGLCLSLLFMGCLLTTLVQAQTQNSQDSNMSQPPASFDDEQQEQPAEQFTMNEETLPAQPAPYMVDDDPAIQAEPIDDDGDF
ncbi:MAG: hypothetical protein HYV97_16345 [Bdellovibrio sp.]|nr:hypothetical protein [Bdellovibrio sp.]